MPEGALQALPLLERALALEPNYALAHGLAAMYREYCSCGPEDAKRIG